MKTNSTQAVLEKPGLNGEPKRGHEPMITPVKKSRISQEAVIQLTNLILKGDFRAGDKLPPERGLARELSITRTTLREALRQMESMGLVRIRQGDGNYVEDPRLNTSLEFVNFLVSAGIGLDRKFIMDLEETRRIFAAEIVGLAAERMDDETLARLRDILDRFPTELTPEFISGEWDFKFFLEIARGTQNMVFVNLLNTIKDLFGKLRWVYCQLDESPKSVVINNRKLLEAFEARDKKLAVSIVERQMKKDAQKLALLLDQVAL